MRLGALAVLAFVFASLLALVPLAVAAVSILSTFLVVLALTYLTDVSFIVQFLVALVGLGLAIDYSLLFVTRWREERDRGADNQAAVVKAVETAGHTVAVSGVTVAIGLVALDRDSGAGASQRRHRRHPHSARVHRGRADVAAGDPRRHRPTRRLAPRPAGEAGKSAPGRAWARLIVRRRWIAVGVAAVALAFLIVPIFSMKVGETSVQALAKTGPARVAYDEHDQRRARHPAP